MSEKKAYITYFHVQKMWQRIDVQWNNINNDVNILVGINGSGKTTLLNLISDHYLGRKIKKEIAESTNGTDINSPITYIRSFDIPAKAPKKTESILLQNLKNIINQNGEGSSFFDYRMRMLNFPEEADKIRNRIDKFFILVNSIFEETGKKIIIDPKNNSLAFSISETGNVLFTADGKRLVFSDNKKAYTKEKKIQLDQLSSGEKQILLILTTVFLQEEKPNILLMDEPEISLHITWQDRLIEMIRVLNPNCQLILTTHSPNIFANGWEDKIVFIQDLENI